MQYTHDAAQLSKLAKHSQQAKACLNRLRCIVIDSAPSPFHDDVAARAVTAWMTRKEVPGVQLRHPLLVGALGALLGPYMRLGFVQRDADKVREKWRTTLHRLSTASSACKARCVHAINKAAWI